MAASRRAIPKSNLSTLQSDYAQNALMATKVVRCLTEQFAALIESNGVTLGVPMESRVKSWASIKDKIERNDLSIQLISEVQDLCGVRIILLFRDDLEVMDKVIRDNLDVTDHEDTFGRLDHDQFGYQSNHYAVRIPSSWSSLPSYAELSGQRAEIQVRTLAQHIWAAASHKLQYKHEDSVPHPLRRSINRVSALLETVDLEFTRILSERNTYVEEKHTGYSDNETLNVDLLVKVLSDIYPEENADTTNTEPFDLLLREATSKGITTVKELKDALIPLRSKALEDDKERVLTFDPSEESDRQYYDDALERVARGVFYSHVGLARISLARAR